MHAIAEIFFQISGALSVCPMCSVRRQIHKCHLAYTLMFVAA